MPNLSIDRLVRRSKLHVASILLIIVAALGCNPAMGVGKDAQQILAASDAIRNPGRPFSVSVTLTEFLSGKQIDSNTLTTWSRAQEQSGQFASLVRFALPPRDTGKLILKNGSDLWFFDPVNKATVRLSTQQRLLGQASNGDVVTVNFSKDYQATLLGEEEVQDGERRPRNAFKLGLKASVPDATYAGVELWVDVDNSRPIKARFFADSGRLLKTAYYRRFQQQLGAERPTETVIIDGLNPQSVTIMRFSDYNWRAVPDSWLHPDNLPRFQPE